MNEGPLVLRLIFTSLLAMTMMWLPLHAQTPAATPTPPSNGPSLLFDAKTGEVIFQDRAGEPWYPASLTKLMTAYVIFQKLREGKLTLEQQIPVSELAHLQEPSKIGVPTGKTVSVDFALQALLVFSANDMAYVLAEAASGSYQNFANEMNDNAKKLGLGASHFVNPNGLFDPRHVTSARDIGVIAAVLINSFPEHQHYFSQQYLQIGKRRLANRNSLIRIMPEADGMKTGFVCNSGFNLVASATRNGRRLVAVVLGAKSGGARALNAKQLLEQGFAKPESPQSPKVGDILDLPQGAIVPADKTTAVCRSKTPVQLADGHDLGGWAVSFGTYDDMQKADMALRGRLLNPIGINTQSSVGVVRLPDKAGFGALMWNITQQDSLKLCSAYRTEGAYCDVMPPAVVDQVALYVKSLQPVPRPVAQGADEDNSIDQTEPPHRAGPPARARMVRRTTVGKKRRVHKSFH
jgi:D-alanyl-D-alanine carboxypeptidase